MIIFLISFVSMANVTDMFRGRAIFDRICLVNNAVYVAKLADDDPENPGTWTATGTQFQIPYVFKKPL